MVAEKKIEENCLLYNFSIQAPKFSPFMLVEKENSRTHNQLHAIVLSNTWHC